ncbi:MAG: hypothetical protein AAGU32_09075 [Bacillota bacterium]
MKKIMNDTVRRETAAHVNAVEFTLENIVRMTQSELKQAVKRELEARAYRPISKKGFLYAEGHSVLKGRPPYHVPGRHRGG